jgi:PUA domain protein
MCPGITSKGGAIPVELPEGAPVAVYAEGKEHALAIGILTMSTEDM